MKVQVDPTAEGVSPRVAVTAFGRVGCVPRLPQEGRRPELDGTTGGVNRWTGVTVADGVRHSARLPQA